MAERSRGRPDIAAIVFPGVGALVLLVVGPIIGWAAVGGLTAIFAVSGGAALVRPIRFPPDGYGQTAWWEIPLIVLCLVLYGAGQYFPIARVAVVCLIPTGLGYWSVSTLMHARRLRRRAAADVSADSDTVPRESA